MTARVYLEQDGENTVIVIDNPPINAGSAAAVGLPAAATLHDGLVDQVANGELRTVAATCARSFIGRLISLSRPGFVASDLRYLLTTEN
jgi:hypothetical protein